MENWGYYLLPKSHWNSPGYTGLLVAIRADPSRMHYDPQSIRLRLRDKHGEATWMTFGLSASSFGMASSFHETILSDELAGVNFRAAGRHEVPRPPVNG